MTAMGTGCLGKSTPGIGPILTKGLFKELGPPVNVS
jgi:hypothetical protein